MFLKNKTIWSWLGMLAAGAALFVAFYGIQTEGLAWDKWEMKITILLIAGVAGGAVFWFNFRKPKTKTSGNSDLEDYDFGEDDEEIELDDADLMAETESEDDE